MLPPVSSLRCGVHVTRFMLMVFSTPFYKIWATSGPSTTFQYLPNRRGGVLGDTLRLAAWQRLSSRAYVREKRSPLYKTLVRTQPFWSWPGFYRLCACRKLLSASRFRLPALQIKWIRIDAPDTRCPITCDTPQASGLEGPGSYRLSKRWNLSSFVSPCTSVLCASIMAKP